MTRSTGEEASALAVKVAKPHLVTLAVILARIWTTSKHLSEGPGDTIPLD
jgi:hypothetical protein